MNAPSSIFSLMVITFILTSSLVVDYVTCKKTLVVGVSTGRAEAYEHGVEVALKHINNQTQILPGYELEVAYISQIAQFSLTVTLLTGLFEKSFEANKSMPAYIGPLGSSDIEFTNLFFNRYSVLQVNANAPGHDFTSVAKYPYLFNICVLLDTYLDALATFLLRNNWRRVAVYHASFARDFYEQYYKAASLTENYITRKGVHVTTVESLLTKRGLTQNTTTWHTKLKKQRDNDVRIFIFNMNVGVFKHLLCELYKLNMYGKKYVHILFHSADYHLWQRFSRANCTTDQEATVMRNFVVMNRAAKEDDDLMTSANYTVGQIFKELNASYLNVPARQQKRNFEEPLLDDSLYFYDATWAVARSIDAVLKDDPSYIETFDYKRNNTKLNLFARKFEDLDFQGATRRIKFVRDETNNTREIIKNDIGFYRVSQYTDARVGIIERLATIGDNGVHLQDFPKKWGFEIPLDRMKEIEKVERYEKTTLIVLWVLAGTGTIISLIFLTFNIFYRQMTFIKLSSPNINNLICFGGIVLYASVIIGGLDTTVVTADQIPVFCDLTSIVLSIGFTLTFGALFSKTWRIYRIFTKKNSIRSVVIRDTHLFGVVMFLLLIDLIIFITSLFVSPSELQRDQLEITTDAIADTVTKNVVYKCHSEYQDYFYATIFLYKGLLMAFGLFLAYETRNIRVKSINDSKFIGLAVYNLVFFGTLGAIVVTALENTSYFRQSYIVFSVLIIHCTTVTLCLVFTPKMLKIFKNYEDPHFRNGRPVIDGEYVRTSSVTKTGGSNSNSNSDARPNT